MDDEFSVNATKPPARVKTKMVSVNDRRELGGTFVKHSRVYSESCLAPAPVQAPATNARTFLYKKNTNTKYNHLGLTRSCSLGRRISVTVSGTNLRQLSFGVSVKIIPFILRNFALSRISSKYIAAVPFA